MGVSRAANDRLLAMARTLAVSAKAMGCRVRHSVGTRECSRRLGDALFRGLSRPNSKLIPIDRRPPGKFRRYRSIMFLHVFRVVFRSRWRGIILVRLW